MANNLRKKYVEMTRYIHQLPDWPSFVWNQQVLAAPLLEQEMSQFLKWANESDSTDPVLRAALAHLWFVTIHPFDDGNGRIARAIADWFLARSEKSAQRFYSMSAQIRQERNDYYGILERTSKGTLDITPWMEWFLRCLGRAFDGTENTLASVLHKARFGKSMAGQSMIDNGLF